VIEWHLQPLLHFDEATGPHQCAASRHVFTRLKNCVTQQWSSAYSNFLVREDAKKLLAKNACARRYRRRRAAGHAGDCATHWIIHDLPVPIAQYLQDFLTATQ